MQKIILLLLTTLWMLPSFAQPQLYTGRIVDAETGEAMPSAALYISPGNGVITNVDGNFELKAAPTDMIRITFVGYSTINLHASELKGTIKMQPLASELQEVTVLGTDAILGKVRSALINGFTKHKQTRSHYFARITLTFGEQTEMIEAFLEASSAVNLRQIGVSNGRYWAESPDGKMKSSLTETNMHLLYSLGPLIRGEEGWANFIKYPFAGVNVSAYIHRLYDVSQATLTDSDDHTTHCFTLHPKRERNNGFTLGGKLYIDAQTLQLLTFEGSLLHMPVQHTRDEDTQEDTYLDIKLHIDYQHKNGFTEVKNIICTATNPDITCHMSLVNVEDHHFPFTYARRIDNNILDAILDAGTNPDIENQFTFIQRTDRETKLITNGKD